MTFIVNVNMQQLNGFLIACKTTVFDTIIETIIVEPNRTKQSDEHEYYLHIKLKGFEKKRLEPEQVFFYQALFNYGFSIGIEIQKYIKQ